MLPKKFPLTQKTEEALKREKARTGVPPNIRARELFFRSIEFGAIKDLTVEIKPGNMELDKSTWLGSLELSTETVIKNTYGDLEPEKAKKAWALHVEHAMLVQNSVKR